MPDTYGPIEAKHHADMNAVADYLKAVFRGHGFALLVFDFHGVGRMNYISNANRDDMLAAMNEFIGHMAATGKAGK